MARILQVFRPRTGGTFGHVRVLAAELQARGHEVAVCGPPGEGPDFAVPLLPAPIPRAPTPALAAAIRARMAPLPDEIAFVEVAPRFGLRFYLGSEIERLELPDDPPRAQAQDLATELLEHEGCRLLLVSPERRAPLERALAMRRAEWVRVGELRGYAALAQFSADCAWRADAGGMLRR